ncbi:hypothetical protein BCR33DRAFT_22650 [Rhizoclosmatium globosum]|uniref:Uncharacterized protein n=1 Tax=Rhizoclosmatium globosum TaxID=329046 RepID=A0A1Y2AYC5_9FUNG|nr:hypothetical protein BCR33DRAFT_22650 [Rhizoclosmatium globosum]|eukprot:ORY27571.1 hypothetical protein BCR33DRAFT_22650 [Rhizoclosmatium globosum]
MLMLSNKPPLHPILRLCPASQASSNSLQPSSFNRCRECALFGLDEYKFLTTSSSISSARYSTNERSTTSATPNTCLCSVVCRMG